MCKLLQVDSRHIGSVRQLPPPAKLFFLLFLGPHKSLEILLYVYLSICLSVCLSIYLSVFLFVTIIFQAFDMDFISHRSLHQSTIKIG